ncbi:histidinol-phosphate transaminase [Clostridium sp. WILCCON 0269]|uniref:Histidinol-phosphate aminotransferase n=1 Tax=Candidatus Clostridium eludens TaxID=3381663 RepID=A0ABW8SG60_9CLOT
MTKLKCRNSLNNIQVHKPSKAVEKIQRELGPNNILRLSANENTNGCSPLVEGALKEYINKLYLYPDGICSEVREILANIYDLKLEQFIFGNGSFEIIELIAQTFINPQDESIIPDPSFWWYKTATLKMDGVVVSVPLKDHRVDLKKIADKITNKTKIIWLCNPNNPTGTIFKKKELMDFLESVPKNIILVFDEAYYELVSDPQYPQTTNLLYKYENIIILRTFSKVYGLAGLRIGYGIANKHIIAYLNKIRMPANVNALAQVAAAASLKDEDFKRKCIESNTVGKQYFYKTFKEMKLEYIPTETNFIMVNVGKDSTYVANKILEKGIDVHAGTEFNMPTWLRVTIGRPEENKLFIESLRDIVLGSTIRQWY